MIEEEGSLIRRALERIGLFRKGPELSLSWPEDASGDDGLLFRAIDVDLPPLDAGKYILRLEMEIPYRSTVVSNRRIEVS